MKVTVLVENSAQEPLQQEWGLSIFIEYQGKNFLLDTGSSPLFTENAKKLGIDLTTVDYAVLSHGHNDHANGMGAFFAANTKAKFYLRKEAIENCYTKMGPFRQYIGIKRGTLKKYEERIVHVEGDYELMPGAYLIPHKTSGLEQKGKEAKMYVKEKHRLIYDSFAHEQSLVFDTPQGLVIFNSCSHGGVDNILKEIKATFPDKPIYAMLGGFHLFAWPKEKVEELAKLLQQLEVAHLYTGHCTGKKAYAILQQTLGDRLAPMTTGTVLEL